MWLELNELYIWIQIKIKKSNTVMILYKYSNSKFYNMIYNSVLKNLYEVNYAIDRLDSLGLSPHPDRVKSWDTYKMVDIISRADRVSFILDVGCNGSPVMPILKRLGFKNLYGCDLFLKNIDYTLMQVDYSLNRPITDFS
jgi:hypothetical protein